MRGSAGVSCAAPRFPHHRPARQPAENAGAPGWTRRAPRRCGGRCAVCKMPIVAASARACAIRSSMRLGSARQSGRGRWRGRWPELLLDAVGRAADRNAGRECALSRFGPAAGFLGAPCWKKDVVGSVVSAGRLMPPDNARCCATAAGKERARPSPPRSPSRCAKVTGSRELDPRPAALAFSRCSAHSP